MPLVAFALAAAAIVAFPVSIHFEGNDATAEPFLYVLAVAAIAGAIGAVAAGRQDSRALFVLNALAAAVALFSWVALVTYEGD